MIDRLKAWWAWEPTQAQSKRLVFLMGGLVLAATVIAMGVWKSPADAVMQLVWIITWVAVVTRTRVDLRRGQTYVKVGFLLVWSAVVPLILERYRDRYTLTQLWTVTILVAMTIMWLRDPRRWGK